MSKSEAAARIVAHLETMVVEKRREVMLIQCQLSTLESAVWAARAIQENTELDEARGPQS